MTSIFAALTLTGALTMALVLSPRFMMETAPDSATFPEADMPMVYWSTSLLESAATVTPFFAFTVPAFSMALASPV